MGSSYGLPILTCRGTLSLLHPRLGRVRCPKPELARSRGLVSHQERVRAGRGTAAERHLRDEVLQDDGSHCVQRGMSGLIHFHRACVS